MKRIIIIKANVCYEKEVRKLMIGHTIKLFNKDLNSITVKIECANETAKKIIEEAKSMGFIKHSSYHH